MGDIADMMLDGTCCQGCGELLSDDAPGHPRTCPGCSGEQIDGDAFDRLLPRSAATIRRMQAEQGGGDPFDALKTALSAKPKRKRKRARHDK